MRFFLADNIIRDKWDRYITTSPEGMFSQLYGWGEIYALYGYRSFPIVAMDNDERLRGVFRLFLVKNLVGNRFLISNPFLSYGGICADDDEIRNKLFLKGQEIASQHRVEYIEIRQFSGKLENLITKSDFATMFLKLNRDEDSVWKNSLKAKTRNQVRKAIKSGLTVDFGNQYFDDFYKVLSINHRDFGTPLHNKLFFRKVLDEFKHISGIIVVKYREKVIAGMLFIYCRNIFSDPWASSMRKYNELCPNNLLYWEAIKYACRNGFDYFDFGRSTINCGTYNFKKQWGSEHIQLNYQYSLHKASKIPVVTAHDNKYQLVIDIWKKMPLKIANFIGPRVIRYLPEL